MENIKISIIIPVFNVEDYLEECMNSIINQSLKEIEIILIDDGSNDSSPEICDRYCKKDKRIVVIHIQNSGNVAARREGLKIAQGEYIGFVDSDDWIDKTMFEELYHTAVTSRADIITSGFIVEDSDNFILQQDAFPCGYYDKQSLYETVYSNMFDYKNSGLFGIQTSLWSKLFKKSIIFDIFMEVDKRIFYAEDAAIVFTSLLKANSIYIADKCYYHYRKRQNSICTTRNIKIFESNIWFYEYMRQKLQEYNVSDLLAEQFNRFLVRLNNYAMKMCYGLDVGYSSFYLFPFNRIPKESRIILYGAGEVGAIYYKQIQKLDMYHLVAWVDSNYIKYQDKGFNVVAPKIVNRVEFDYLVIAVKRDEIAQTIIRNMEKMGVSKEKMIFGEIPKLEDVKVIEYRQS